MNCAACRFYHLVHGGPFGQCRYNPPAVVVNSAGVVTDHWPRPLPIDWCSKAEPIKQQQAKAA